MYSMYVLAFPLGFLWSFAFHGVLQPLLGQPIHGFPIPVQAVFLFAYYLGYVAIGYLQWFILLPRLFRRPKPNAS